MKVADASVVVPALADEAEAGHDARRALAGDEIVAPELLDLEVVSAVRGLLRGGILDSRGATRALGRLRRAHIVRSPHAPLIPRIWELRDNLGAYDASYVALAEGLRAVLVTGDRALATAPGVRCEIELIG